MEVFETKTRLLYKAYERRLLPQGKLAGLQSGSLRKHPFFLALRRWGRFAQGRPQRAAKSQKERIFSQAESGMVPRQPACVHERACISLWTGSLFGERVKKIAGREKGKGDPFPFFSASVHELFSREGLRPITQFALCSQAKWEWKWRTSLEMSTESIAYSRSPSLQILR